MVSIRTLIILFFLLGGISPLLSAATISVTADRNSVSLNESFQLIYKASGDVDDDPDFSVLIPYVDILSQSQSSNVSIINGSYSSSKTWTLQVMATEAGKMTLPPVPFGRDNSESITLMVNPANTGPAVGQQDANFFVEMDLDASQVYVQQQLLLTQRIYSRQNLQAYAFGDLDFSGFDVLVEPLGDEKQYQTRRGNVAYLVIEKRFALYPQSAGEFTIKPLLAEARTGSSSGSFFDPFGRNSQVVRARSNPYKVKVLSIPDNVDMPVWLPARQLEITEQWQQPPLDLKVGEPVTRTLSIKAEGLTAAQIPELPQFDHPSLKQYPDQPMINDVTNESGITGYRIEKIAYIPTVDGRIELPAITIPWWNTVTGQVEVASIPAQTLKVNAIVSSSKPVPPSTVAPLIPKVDQSADKSLNQNPTETVVIENSGPWKGLAIIALVGWLITIAAGWWLFKRKSTTESSNRRERSIDNTSQSIAAALKAVTKACQTANAVLLRQRIIDWAATLWPHQPVVTLAEIRRKVDPELSDLLSQLDQSLYAPASSTALSDNEFKRIVSAIKQFTERTLDERKHRESMTMPGQLEPLYR